MYYFKTVSSSTNLKCNAPILHKSIHNVAPLNKGCTQNVENKLPFLNEKVEEDESDNNQWTEYSFQKDVDEYITRTSEIIKKQIFVRNVDKIYCIFVSNFKHLEVTRTQTFLISKLNYAKIYYCKNQRNYTTSRENKPDIIFNSGGELIQGKELLKLKQKNNKDKEKNVNEAISEKDVQINNGKQSEKWSQQLLILDPNEVCPKLQIDRTNCPKKNDQIGHEDKNFATPISQIKEESSKKVINEAHQDKKEDCQKIEIYKVNCPGRDNSIKKVKSKETFPKQPVETLKTYEKNGEEKTINIKERPRIRKTRCKICKQCFPKNKLHKFRPPPTWKIWLYSILGINLPEPPTYPPKLVCCQKKFSKEELQVQWIKLAEYPKPILQPSIRYLKQTPEQRLKIVRTKKLKSDVPYTNEHKEFFMKSLPIPDRAKWAANIPDDKLKGEQKLCTIKQQYQTNISIKKDHPPVNSSLSSIESIQKKTSVFCETLVDLCTNKQIVCKTCTVKSVENKVDISKHISPTKVTEKKSDKKSSNSLIPNEVFRLKRNKPLTMPDRYYCGAGEIEKKIILERKKQNVPYEVQFKYREHCKRNTTKQRQT